MRRCAIAFSVALAFAPTPTVAQPVTARIEGVVTDVSGAPLPVASVAAIQDGTNLAWTTVTTETGQYTFAALPPGRFRVEVRRSGFRTAVITDLQLESGETARADAVLAVGQLSESLVVAAQATGRTRQVRASRSRTGNSSTTASSITPSRYAPSSGLDSCGPGRRTDGGRYRFPTNLRRNSTAVELPVAATDATEWS